jgi:hypothetical protein
VLLYYSFRDRSEPTVNDQKPKFFLNFKFSEKINAVLDYPVKILIAFGEAVDENNKFLYWLLENGYPELGALANSLHLNTEAFNWLMKNHYPHFAALSKAVYDDKNAMQWLRVHQFALLIQIVEAALNNPDAIDRFRKDNLEIFIILSKKIATCRKRKLDNLSDYHKLHF